MTVPIVTSAALVGRYVSGRFNHPWLGMVVALLALAGLDCQTMGQSPAYPLYINPASHTLGPGEVATLRGPIASVDGQDVASKGTTFQLLPGCHIVTLLTHIGGSSPAGDGAWSGTLRERIVYAFRMEAASSYTISFETEENGGTYFRLSIKARVRDSAGVTKLVGEARSQADVDECRGWAAAQGLPG